MESRNYAGRLYDERFERSTVPTLMRTGVKDFRNMPKVNPMAKCNDEEHCY